VNKTRAITVKALPEDAADIAFYIRLGQRPAGLGNVA